MQRLTLLILIMLLTAPAAAQELGCGVSTIPREQIRYGCGCGYHLRTDDGLQTLFQAELDGSEPRMFIDGELVELTASPENADNQYSEVGDEFVETYQDESLTILFRNRVSFTCGEWSAGCEVTRFDTTLHIGGASCSVEVADVIGACGC